MSPLYIILMILHLLIAVALVLVILAQSSKGGALDGMLGGTASNVLGGQGASKFLQNATRILATLFMLMCILLAFQVKKGRKASSSSKALEKYKDEITEESVNEEDLQDFPLTEEPVENTESKPPVEEKEGNK